MLKPFVLAATSFGLASAAVTCENLADNLSFEGVDASIASTSYHTAGETIKIDGDQSVCFSETQTEIDMCRVTLTVATSGTSHNYVEVWLPSGNNPWNGRMLHTYNGGLAGCVEYKDMKYMSSLSFATVGDNGGHNSTTADGSKLLNDNEAVIDLSYRSRHLAVVAAKQVIKAYYNQAANYST